MVFEDAPTPPLHELTSSTKPNSERVCFLIETDNQRIHDTTFLRMSKKPLINDPPEIKIIPQ